MHPPIGQRRDVGGALRIGFDPRGMPDTRSRRLVCIGGNAGSLRIEGESDIQQIGAVGNPEGNRYPFLRQAGPLITQAFYRIEKGLGRGSSAVEPASCALLSWMLLSPMTMQLAS